MDDPRWCDPDVDADCVLTVTLMADVSQSIPVEWAATTAVGTNTYAGGTQRLPLRWSATSVGLSVANTSWVGDDVDRHQIPLLWSTVIEVIP